MENRTFGALKMQNIAPGVACIKRSGYDCILTAPPKAKKEKNKKKFNCSSIRVFQNGKSGSVTYIDIMKTISMKKGVVRLVSDAEGIGDDDMQRNGKRNDQKG